MVVGVVGADVLARPVPLRRVQTRRPLSRLRGWTSLYALAGYAPSSSLTSSSQSRRAAEALSEAILFDRGTAVGMRTGHIKLRVKRLKLWWWWWWW